MRSPVTVLMGFADALPAPEVTWSLADGGFRVVTFARHGSQPPIRRSRHVELVYVTDPADSAERSIEDLGDLVSRLDQPILMPLDDASLWLVSRLAADIEVRVAGATGVQAELALDKRMQFEAAAAAGFAVPETTHINTAADLSAVTHFPAILKPALAARELEGRLSRAGFHGIADQGELDQLCSKLQMREPHLLQPVLQGIGEGLFGLAGAEGVVQWSGHRRVRMMNPSGSGSSACRSIEPDLEIREVAERFLLEIGWRGLFMIELLRDAGDTLWFMEINGRPWGSMALARRMGLEYPRWAVERVLDPSFSPATPVQNKPGVLCRHLGRELVHVALVLRGARSKAFQRLPTRLGTLWNVLRVSWRDTWYNWRRDDKRVFFSDAWQTVRSHLWPRGGRNGVRAGPRRRGLWRRVTDRLRRPFVRRQQARFRARGTLARRLESADRILFLCYGNINRSALAERHLLMVAPDVRHVSSCGFHVPDRRPADPRMCELAAAHGIALDPWSSRTIDALMVAEADVILAMEAKHLVSLFAEYPRARDRAFLLSCATEPDSIPLEIQDPFGQTPELYERCIREVTRATSRIAAIMAGPRTRETGEEQQVKPGEVS